MFNWSNEQTRRGGRHPKALETSTAPRVFLRDKLSAWLKANKAKYGDSTLKYIDPSYTIRSCPASSNDAAFCVQLANCAVHEGVGGKKHWRCIAAIAAKNQGLSDPSCSAAILEDSFR